MKKTLIVLGIILAVSIVAYLVVIFSYVVNFGATWSCEQGDWGTFGDFVGGTLNPLFSFMALIAILITIVLQSKELEQTRIELARTAEANEKQSIYLASQQQRDDIYRLISKLAERINNTYNKNHLPNEHSIYTALIGPLNVNDNDAYFTLTGEMLNPQSSGYSRVKYIESDLKSLASLLDEYEVISSKISSKPTPLRSFYVNEYSHMVKVFCDEKWFDEALIEYYSK
ncbi:conserved hypothetical protein [Desulforapulum autotrophicum HRM2]|uniref:Phage abortive infection protein n=1 Tax=Desulforapulum autotrophicum (strain ATCC 43914 / DSM 3382 / VKM B-1955 / HRM2) TaxID=177437 RepID=C0QF03_DESAH|nr:hypothetical protein [Desulforapulum autotrophicum]ACN17504.1 conserved hypothetical protein [Desulforapulum autotrophicum HRM2]